MSSQRETYQAPTSQTPAGGGGGGGMMLAPGADDGMPMKYICGDCGTTFPLKRTDTIRCVECGCRVLYKERTKR